MIGGSKTGICMKVTYRFIMKSWTTDLLFFLLFFFAAIIIIIVKELVYKLNDFSSSADRGGGGKTNERTGGRFLSNFFPLRTYLIISCRAQSVSQSLQVVMRRDVQETNMNGLKIHLQHHWRRSLAYLPGC